MSHNAGTSSSKNPNAKPRNPNFTEQEKLTLIQFVSENKLKLFGKAGHCSTKVEERKKKTWDKAVDAIRATGGPKVRGRDEIKTQWVNLKGKAIKYDMNKKKTGGGPQPPFNAVFEALLAAIAPEARDGVRGLASEANPLGGEEASQGSSQESSQEQELSQPRVADDATTPEMAAEPRVAAATPNIPKPSSTNTTSTPPTKPSNKGSDIRYLQVQERMLRYEEERVDIMRQTLQVQREISESLKEITKTLLFKSLQSDL